MGPVSMLSLSKLLSVVWVCFARTAHGEGMCTIIIKIVEFPTESVFFGQYRSVFFGICKYHTGDKIGQYVVLYVTTIKYVI